MAISIDKVYQRVLALANKEQRGYITPQEFNLLANQAQMQIFESYFYQKNLRDRKQADVEVDNEANIDELLDRKLSIFRTVATVTGGTTFPAHYQIGDIYCNGYVCAKADLNEINRLNRSRRHYDNSIEPVYAESAVNGEDIIVYKGGTQQTGSSVTCEVFSKPSDAAWGYVVVNNRALYNSGTTTDFSLHDSEEDTLVMKILALAGITINKAELIQAASAIDGGETQIQIA